MFPDASALKNTANLGRLNVTRALGDIDGDGDYDALYTLGGRSFSIWTHGRQRRSTTAAAISSASSQLAIPAFFNASNDDRTFDSRSDNKGPEPEGVAMGEIGKRTYAFIGLERMGGVMVYDVTNPIVRRCSSTTSTIATSRSIQRLAPEAKDLGPEGLIFIAANDSPTHRPLLVVANEVSGTVTLYEITARDDDDNDD